MLLIRKRAYARAGLMGNPSDGYHGKTLSVLVRRFCAEVTLYEWDRVELVWSEGEQTRFRSVDELTTDVRLHGYYGGIRLVKATIKKFVEYCRRRGHPLHEQNFSVRYQSDIPRQVGLAGSSAIIIATLRCLMKFYGVEIPREVQPSLALSVETEELGISAGLQDRVVQVYGAPVFMDFAKNRMRKVHGFPCGVYEPLDGARLPPLYVAYSTAAGEPTERVHGELRVRFDQGEKAVLDAMTRFAELARQARDAVVSGEPDRLGPLIDANFDLRRSICRIPHRQMQMVERARRLGATAKFAGSGGAIIGTYPDEAALGRLTEDLAEIGCRVFKLDNISSSKFDELDR